MQKTKILITALALTLCTLSFASCGNGNVEESGSTAPGSTTESATKETESRVETTTERPGTTSTESTQGTTGTNGTTGTTESMTESSGGTTNTTGSETTAPESGSVTDSIGDDVRRGADNVKNGVKDFFGMGDENHDGMRHRPRVPYGK